MQYLSTQVDTAAGWQGAHWKWWAGHIRAPWSTQICMQSLRFHCCGCDLTSDCFPMERKTQAKLEHTPVYYASHSCKWALFAEGTAGFSPDPQGSHKHLWAFESAQSPNWHAAWKTRHSKLIQISQLKKRQTQIMTKAVLFSHPCSIMLLFCTVADGTRWQEADPDSAFFWWKIPRIWRTTSKASKHTDSKWLKFTTENHGSCQDDASQTNLDISSRKDRKDNCGLLISAILFCQQGQALACCKFMYINSIGLWFPNHEGWALAKRSAGRTVHVQHVAILCNILNGCPGKHKPEALIAAWDLSCGWHVQHFAVRCLFMFLLFFFSATC